MNKFVLILFLPLLLIGCDKKDYSTPAQSHINNYRKQVKRCVAGEGIDGDAKQAPSKEVETAQQSEPQSQDTVSADNLEKADYGAVFEIYEDDIVLGNRDADVVVIEYSSPTCAHCAYYHKSVYPELKKNYIDNNKIAYVIRQFIANKQDLDSTILAVCSGKENAVKMLEIFFSQQDKWAFNTNFREILTNIGQLAGVSPEQYAKCLQDNNIISTLIGKSRAVSQVEEFVGTPSFIINGKVHKKAYSYQNLSEAIDKAKPKNQ